MQEETEFSSLPLEVENSFDESFSNCYFTRSDDFSDVEKSGLFGGDLDLLGDSDEGFDESFQSLNSPFDWEMDQEFFKSDVEIGECKSNGPTLAELNGERPLSPLINPEMERLHRVATRTDGEPTGSIVTKIPPRRLFEPKVSLELYRPQVNRTCDNVKGGKEEETIEFGERFGRVVVKEEAVEKTAEFSPSAPIESQRSGKIQLEKTEKAWISLPQERKIDGKQPSAIPQLVSPEVKSRVFYSPLAQLQGQVPEENKGSVSEECLVLSNRNIKLEPEESDDEDMDSDEDDFEDNENEEHGEFSVNRNRKGRRGECDDLVPNPRRLLDIGRELERLNRVIGDLKPIHQLPVNARNKSRKEKNKLASRACRLKKKAQYEANKLKLHGLELEQQRLTKVMEQMKEEIVAATQHKPEGSLCSKLDILIKSVLGTQRVAGHTSQFVDSVLKATARDNCLEEIHLNV